MIVLETLPQGRSRSGEDGEPTTPARLRLCGPPWLASCGLWGRGARIPLPLQVHPARRRPLPTNYPRAANLRGGRVTSLPPVAV
jgi:hypothetical protein